MNRFQYRTLDGVVGPIPAPVGIYIRESYPPYNIGY